VAGVLIGLAEQVKARVSSLRATAVVAIFSPRRRAIAV
jgi:hypothetical protein